MAVPQPELIRLCSHARTGKFKCGDERFDFNLRSYQQRLLGADEACVFTLVTQLREVVGFISICDLYAEDELDGTTMRWFVIPALAVAKDSQGGNYAARLARHVYEIAKTRQATHMARTGKRFYDAIACTNWTPAIEKSLKRLDFQPSASNQQFCWWVRPL